MSGESREREILLCQGVLDTLREGVYVADRERAITYWNRGAEQITGYRAEEVVQLRCRDRLLEHVDKEGNVLCDQACPLVQAMEENRLVEVEAYLIHKQGHRIPVHVRAAPVVDQWGEVVGACEVFGDISSRMTQARRLKELEQLAMLDHLTGLANRRYLEHHLAEWLEQVRHTPVAVGVILYDIDHFKQVNDLHGHTVGDQVLQTVAKTLLASARPPDLVGRWGGEEFMQVLTNLPHAYLAEVAERNRMLVAQSRPGVAPHEVRVTVSLGATLMRADDTLTSLFRRVDELLYQSKADGRNCVTLDGDPRAG